MKTQEKLKQAVINTERMNEFRKASKVNDQQHASLIKSISIKAMLNMGIYYIFGVKGEKLTYLFTDESDNWRLGLLVAIDNKTGKEVPPYDVDLFYSRDPIGIFTTGYERVFPPMTKENLFTISLTTEDIEEWASSLNVSPHDVEWLKDVVKQMNEYKDSLGKMERKERLDMLLKNAEC